MHCSRRRLLRRGLEFHVCTINKSAHRKKVRKLNQWSSYIYIYIYIYLSLSLYFLIPPILTYSRVFNSLPLLLNNRPTVCGHAYWYILTAHQLVWPRWGWWVWKVSVLEMYLPRQELWWINETLVFFDIVTNGIQFTYFSEFSVSRSIFESPFWIWCEVAPVVFLSMSSTSSNLSMSPTTSNLLMSFTSSNLLLSSTSSNLSVSSTTSNLLMFSTTSNLLMSSTSSNLLMSSNKDWHIDDSLDA